MSGVAKVDLVCMYADPFRSQSVKSVRPAFEAFYATLSDEQKASLNGGSGRGRFWHWRDRW